MNAGPREYHIVIKNSAPTLFAFFEILCRDRRTNNPKLPSRIAAIMQIILFTRNQRKCNYQQAIIGLIFHSQGASKPIFLLLNALGITESYNAVLQSLEGLHHEAKVEHKAFITSPWLTGYDNLDVSIDTHEQTMTQ
jgi:hypothetical protein